MRLPFTIALLAVLVAALWETGDPLPASHNSERAIAIFDPDPAHIWNRLYNALLVREDVQGTQYGADSLDPPLWLESEYLLADSSHTRAVRVLDEFLQTHAENLIRDPLKRAILQRDLWAVFDWSVQQSSASQRPHYDREKRELQMRLAEALKRLALSPKEIESLPDNYAQALASGEFAKDYDPAHEEGPFLPPDLFSPRGPWVYIDPSPEAFSSGGVAQAHVQAFSGRSRFLVFIRLPGGRKATLDYLQTIWNFPEPWVHGSDSAPDQARVNPDLPSFPAGTEVALVRQMTLFDNQGTLAPAPITESVQIRAYHAITTTPARDFGSGDMTQVIKNSGQDFYEIKFSRPELFASRAGGLKATGPAEKELSTFQQQGDDEIEELSEHPKLKEMWPPELQTCLSCHSGGGIRSLNSLERLFKPNRRQQDAPANPVNDSYAAQSCWFDDGTESWKQERYDWGLLNGYWKTSTRP
jgi:hypothetical protein